MSELQLSLIALAALALLALYVGEKWQEHRRRRRLHERLYGGVGDALLQPAAPLHEPRALPGERPTESNRESNRESKREPPRAARVHGSGATAQSAAGRLEPYLAGEDEFPSEPVSAAAQAGRPAPSLRGDGGAPAAAVSADWADEIEAAIDKERALGRVASSEALARPERLLRPDWAEDPLLDCTLEIRCARAVDGVSVIDAVAELGHASWSLPVHFVVWDGRHQQWVLPDRFGYYTDALASIQLANRRNCIDEAQIASFVEMVQRLARDLDADFDTPDPVRLVAQAQELDRLCARFDIKLGLTVESIGGGWTGPQLRNAAQECGFIAAGAQRWVRRQQADEEDVQHWDLYSLQAEPANSANPANPTRLLLELDIALAPVAARAFASMAERAQILAAALGGRVVDDNGKPIEAQSIEAIERQLGQVFEEMRAAGIEPGSARARRLYA